MEWHVWTPQGHTIIIQQDMMQGRLLNETVEDVLEDTLKEYAHLITKENILEIE